MSMADLSPSFKVLPRRDPIVRSVHQLIFEIFLRGSSAASFASSPMSFGPLLINGTPATAEETREQGSRILMREASLRKESNDTVVDVDIAVSIAHFPVEGIT